MVQHKDETIKCVTCWEEMWLTQININTFQRDKCICKMPEDQWEKCAAARDKRHKEMLKTKGKPKPKYLMTKEERKKAEQQLEVVQKVDWGRASFTDNTVEVSRVENAMAAVETETLLEPASSSIQCQIATGPQSPAESVAPDEELSLEELNELQDEWEILRRLQPDEDDIWATEGCAAKAPALGHGSRGAAAKAVEDKGSSKAVEEKGGDRAAEEEGGEKEEAGSILAAASVGGTALQLQHHHHQHQPLPGSSSSSSEPSSPPLADCIMGRGPAVMPHSRCSSTSKSCDGQRQPASSSSTDGVARPPGSAPELGIVEQEEQ